MIKGIIKAYLINIFALYATSSLVGSFRLANEGESLLLVGAGFTILYLVLRPILTVILGPLNFLTFGLIGLVADGGILYLLTLYFPQISVSSWMFPGFFWQSIAILPTQLNFIVTLVICAAIINIIRSVLSFIFS